MKTILIGLVGLISFFIIAIVSFAGINDTLQQCEKVYGEGKELSKSEEDIKNNGKSFGFKYKNMNVAIHFDDKGKAYQIFYRKFHNVRPPSTEQDKEGVAAYIKDVIATGITPAECASLLKLNRNCEWIIRRESEDYCNYVTNDGSNLAAYYWKLVPPKRLYFQGVLIGTLGIVRDMRVNQTAASQPE